MIFHSARDVMSKIARETSILKEVSIEEREKLKQVLLGMMQDLHEVCLKYQIGYSLCGGTALGAIRHKGFIPWDDDLDIVMLRNDWENFKLIFGEALGKKYILEAPNYGDKETKTYFGKMYKKGTSLVELQDINAPFEKGIYIDIFIFENVSDNKLVRWMDAKISDFWKAATTSQIYYKYSNDTILQFMNASFFSRIYFSLRKLLGFCCSFVSHKTFVGWYDKFVSRHSLNTENITIPTGRGGYMREVIPRSSWASLELLPFEDKQFYCMSDVVGYCRNLYGETYMQLPPEDKRERHFCVELSFGDEDNNKK